jgi:hypothetical protein
VRRLIRAVGELVSQQSVGILVGAALPRALQMQKYTVMFVALVKRL